MKLTSSQVTQAIQQYARKHGYYVTTVRVITRLRNEAIKEWKAQRQLYGARSTNDGS